MDPTASTTSVFRSRLFLLSAVAVVALHVPFVFIKFLIGDEAQLVAYAGYIARTGAVYGRGFSDMRGPGAYYIYALLTLLLGYGNLIGLHLFAVGYKLLTLVLVCVLARQTFGDAVAGLAGLLYAVFSFAYILHDMVPLNVEAVALPFLLLSSICLLRAVADGSQERVSVRWCFLTGLTAATAFAIKQVVGIALAVYLFLLFLEAVRGGMRRGGFLSSSLVMGGGFLAGLVLFFGPSCCAGQARDAFYWAVVWGSRHYGPGMAGRCYLFVARVFLLMISQPLPWVCGLCWFGWAIRAVAVRGWRSIPTACLLLVFMVPAQMIGLLIAGVIAYVCLPAAAFASNLLSPGEADGSQGAGRVGAAPIVWVARVLFVVGCVAPLLCFLVFPEGVQLEMYSVVELFKENLAGDDPVGRVADFVRQHTSENDTIYQFGGFDMYPLTRRYPAANPASLRLYVDHMNDEFLHKQYIDRVNSLRKAKPKIIILPCTDHGDIHRQLPRFREVADFLAAEYRPPVRMEWDRPPRFGRGKAWMEGQAELGRDIYIAADAQRATVPK